MRKVLVIREDRFGYDPEVDMDDCFLESNTYEVDVAYLADFKINHSHEYNYISKIIELAELNESNGGLTELRAYSLGNHSRKFLFGDTPYWFTTLKPPADEPVDKRFFYYEVH